MEDNSYMRKNLPDFLAIVSLLVVLAFSVASAAGTTYYVSPAGNDKAAGTAAAPWRTLGRAAEAVAAGDTVLVLPGVYDERVKFGAKPSHHGTAAAPVIFKSATPLGATVTGGFDTRNANYLIIDGFRITASTQGTAGGGILVGSHGVTIKNNYFYDIPDAAVRGYLSGSFSPTAVTVINNRLIQNQFGLIVNGADWLVEGNAISLKRWIAGELDYIVATGNNLVFRRNRLFGALASDRAGTTIVGWQITAGPGKKFSQIEISGNIVEAVDEVLDLNTSASGNLSDITVTNNLFSGSFAASRGDYGVYAKRNISGLEIIHNTFTGFTQAGVRLANQSTAIIHNNIFFQSGRNYYADAGSVVTAGRNLISLNHIDTFAEPTDLVNTDPLFINADNPAGHDGVWWTADDGFNLRAGSPAINRALSSALREDIIGQPRPAGGAPDIGAYETIYLDLDTTPPVTTAHPAGGSYTSSQTVFLEANEPVFTYYCLGAACLPQTLADGSISLSTSTNLRFYSVDQAGNVESIKQETYTIKTDVTPPITTVYPLPGAYPLGTAVAFLRNEPATTWYCQISGCVPTILYTAPLVLNGPLTINFYSVDQAGNTEAVKTATFTITSDGSTTTPPTVVTPPVILPPADGSVATTSTTTPPAEPAAGGSFYSAGNLTGGGLAPVLDLATVTDVATSVSPTDEPEIINLKLRVIELQQMLINLLKHLIERGRQAVDLTSEGLAAVGNLFLVGFKL